MRPVVFVPETQRIEVLFKDMRRRRTRLAVAVNEYGGAVGLVSMEDILEEIVGDIDDEFSRRSSGIRKVGEREWIAAGRVEGERLKESVGFEFPDGDYETLAGFLLDRFGHIPATGEKLNWGHHLFTVSKATDRAIVEVTIQDTRQTNSGSRQHG
jgi:CBS domain containing-hemolysin-like protein